MALFRSHALNNTADPFSVIDVPAGRVGLPPLQVLHRLLPLLPLLLGGEVLGGVPQRNHPGGLLPEAARVGEGDVICLKNNLPGFFI